MAYRCTEDFYISMGSFKNTDLLYIKQFGCNLKKSNKTKSRIVREG